MRARPSFLVAALGIAAAAVARTRRRRREQHAHLEASPRADPRAVDLRSKLEESRAIIDERDDFEEAELPIDRAEPVGDPDSRRREVHDAARAAVERMRADRDRD